MPVISGIPSTVLNVVQTGLLKRGWYDALYPALLFRDEAADEEWEGHIGVEALVTRRGLLAPKITPRQPGVDPSPQSPSFEQWIELLEQYGDAMDVHVPTSAHASGDLFMNDVKVLGLSGAQAVNRLVRNRLYKAYEAGHAVLIAATAAGDLTIRVSNLNGFTDYVSTVTVRPVPISASTPLPIQIINGATTISRNAIAYAPDDASDPFGPGTLTLSVAVGAIVAARAPVLATNRAPVVRSGGGLSVDAIGPSDILTLQDVTNAVTILRANRVPTHEDGTYHLHLPPQLEGQVYSDPGFRVLNTGLPDHTYFAELLIARMLGCEWGLNTECPDYSNVGPLVATGTNAFYGTEIGSEVINNSGVNIARAIVTGRGSVYERYVDEMKQYVTEAGLTGKQGDFALTNMGVAVEANHIRLIVRAPVNRAQDTVSLMWSYTGCFPIPTDVASGTSARYKRAVVIQSARD